LNLFGELFAKLNFKREIMKKMLAPLFGLLVLAACQNLEEPLSNVVIPPAHQAPAPMQLAEFRAQVEPLPEPNHYQVRLAWNEKEKALTLARINVDRTSTNTQIPAFEKEKLDTTTIAGSTYSYVLSDSSGKQIGDRLLVAIPNDLEVTGETALGGNLTFNRVFLRKKSRILVDKEPLSITANSFNSDGGVIESGKANNLPPANTAGPSGFHVSVSAQRAIGDLLVIGHGSPGGAGATGVNGTNGIRGGKGKDARTREQHPTGLFGLPASPIALVVCDQAPTEGVRGTDGTDGQDGTDGANGGDSARVVVDVTEASPFNVAIEAEPGKGGAVGQGGARGLGGPGGGPGENKAPCPAAEVGPMGRDGRYGLPGRNAGKAGRRNSTCFRNATNVAGDCTLNQNKLEIK
jgi:hypothetical protein